jgi:hypothetical protein
MKIQDLLEQSGNTSVGGVLTTIRDIVLGKRTGTSPALCHLHTAQNIDPAHPDDRIVLYGYGTTVVHSVVVRDGKLLSNYSGVSSSKLLPSGNLEITVGKNGHDELEPVFALTVGTFLQHIKDQNHGK